MATTTTEHTLAAAWGRRVAEARRRAGLSQSGLADLCGVAQQTVSKIERGRMVPLDKLKLRLAEELGTSPAVLFAWPSRTTDR